MAIPEIGVCSWSVQAKSIPELKRLMTDVKAAVVHVALGDPNHASWEEGEGFLEALKGAHLEVSASMIGFPGEDYTSPQTIKETGGFGDPARRKERLEIFRKAVDMTARLEIPIITSHAGFIPPPGDPERGGLVDCLYEAAEYAESKDVIFAMETGQETAELLRRTLDEISMDSLKVNFDPANMILYNMGDPIRAVEILGPDIVHVHVKDALPPEEDGAWGEEVPLGQGSVGMEAFLEALSEAEYDGPLIVEREVGSQEERVRDIQAGIGLLRKIITGA